MATEYIEPQWLLPNELNQAIPADGATGSGLAEDRQSLYSMDFDGTSDYIDTGNTISFNYNDPFTVSTWVKADAVSGYKTVYYKYDSSISGGRGIIIRLYSSSGSGVNGVYFDLYSTNSGSTSTRKRITTATGTIVDHDIWYLLTATYDGSGIGSGMKIYLNEVPQTVTVTQDNLQSGDITNSLNALIGATYTPSYVFNGNMDEVAIFSRTLSSDEITTLWNSGSPGNAMILEPKAYYPLGEQARAAGSLAAGTADWQFPNQSLESHAFNFNDAASQFVILPQNDNCVPNDSGYTLSGWFNIESVTTAYRTIYSSDYDQGVIIWVDGSTLKALHRQSSSWKYTTASTTIAIDTWYHVALSWDGSTTSKIFLNGVLEGDNTTVTSLNTPPPYNSTDYPAIGNYNANIFDGEISNFQIWNTNLTDGSPAVGNPATGQIAELYNNGTPLNSPVASANLTGWWKLNSSATFDPATSIWSIPDDSTNSNTGTSSGMTQASLVPSDLQFESPYSNFSLEFDGTDDYIEIPRDNAIEPSNITVSCWVNITSGSHNNCYYFSKVDITGNSASYALHRKEPQFTIKTSTGLKISPQYGSSIVDAGWTHLVGTYDGANIRLYVNGSEVGTGTAETGSIVYSTENAYIGAFEYYTPTSSLLLPVEGKIDETAIWDSALTAAQVTQVYNNGYPRDLTFLSPTSWWRLGEDAYFVSPNFTIPNKITGAPNGVTANMDDVDLVADAPGSFGGGLGSSLAVTDRIGDARESTANSVSYNMIPANRTTYPAGYVPTQVDNDWAMAFDGASDYIDLGSSNFGITATTAFSISAWINSPISGTKDILSKRETSGGYTGFTFRLNHSASKAGKVTIILDGTGGQAVATTNTDLNPNIWYNVILTSDGTGSGSGLKIYINGVDDTTGQSGTVTDISNSINTMIGSSAGLASFFSGNIDEVAIFDYALSANQIQQDIYNGGRDPKCADLNNISNLTAPVAWYRMGD